MESSLQSRLRFLVEIDRLKSVYRASPLVDRSRKENSAEHSWHLAMYALVLAEHCGDDLDINLVLKMLLLHDIVEIDAGDSPIHGPTDTALQHRKESEAARRIFGILPGIEGAELKAIWEEFEQGESPEARFAKSLDRLQPLVQNVCTGGGTWVESDVSHQQVRERYGPAIRAGSPELWAAAERLIAAHFSGQGATLT